MMPEIKICKKIKAPERIPCSMYWVDIVFLYCFHLLEYDSYNQLEKKYEIPHSTAQSVIKFMIFKTEFINKRFTDPHDYERRFQVTKNYIVSGEMDKKYSRITVSIDATHRLWNRDHSKIAKKPLYDWSYKLKEFGYNVLFGGFANGYFFYCGIVSASNDKTLLQKGYDKLCVIDERDLIICDEIFRTAIPKDNRRNTLICPWTKPIGEDLPPWKSRENIPMRVNDDYFSMMKLFQLVEKGITFELWRKKKLI
jgi:hypothetical protein